MADRKDFKVGHKVMLVLDGVKGISGDLKIHNQEIFRVGKVCGITKGNVTHRYYELKGLNSKRGVPYAIMPEWLYDIGAWTE